MELKASIIIPTYNRNQIANTCIHSIVQYQMPDVEIIVVNDYKESKFILEPNNKSNMLKLIDNTGKGVASARNNGAKIASSKNLIFVDDDMILNKETILKAIEFLESNPKSTYNANWKYQDKLIDEISNTKFGRYLINNNYTSLKGWNEGGIQWQENTIFKTNGITSQFFGISKSNFELIGCYNEKFPFAGFEDYDIYVKMQKNNIVNYIDSSVMIFHNETDRVSAHNWLERKKRGAKTRKVAVDLGFSELKIEYSPIKKMILSILAFTEPLITFKLKIIPNSKIFDSAFAKILNLLIAVNIFKGYHNKLN